MRYLLHDATTANLMKSIDRFGERSHGANIMWIMELTANRLKNTNIKSCIKPAFAPHKAWMDVTWAPIRNRTYRSINIMHIWRSIITSISFIDLHLCHNASLEGSRLDYEGVHVCSPYSKKTYQYQYMQYT